MDDEKYSPFINFDMIKRLYEVEFLTRSISEQEILDFVNTMDPFKALGPVGFSIGFYSSCLEIIREVFMLMIKEFEANPDVIKFLNSTTIVIILKKALWRTF